MTLRDCLGVKHQVSVSVSLHHHHPLLSLTPLRVLFEEVSSDIIFNFFLNRYIHIGF